MRSQALEEQLRRHQNDPMVAEVLGLGLCVTPGSHQHVGKAACPARGRRPILLPAQSEGCGYPCTPLA